MSDASLDALENDPYLWLEEIDSPAVKAWVETENARCMRALGDTRFEADRKALLAELDRALFKHAGPRPEPTDEATFARRGEILGRLIGGIDEAALRDRLGSVQTPALVVFGTDDLLLPPEMGRLYRAAMPNCSFVLLHDAAHELGWDRPDALAELVGDFARRREAFVVAE